MRADFGSRGRGHSTFFHTQGFLAGLIGPDVLSQFDLTVDYPRNRLIFEKNKHYGRRDSYDRSGMWMGQDGKHFTAL
ncbi:MAG: hypothetical protein ACLP0H_02720 [Terriglobales bacterium]